MKILVFLHGTAIMHASAVGSTREQRVRQVIDGEASVGDFSSYVPTEGAVPKLHSWIRRGGRISYLSSHRNSSLVDLDAIVLGRHGFPEGRIFHRGPSHSYAEIIEKVKPDVLLEDDCESIGGERQMVFPSLRPGLQVRIKSIIVPEFGGLEHLPDDPSALPRS